jgi:hypothetical protein
MTPRLRGRTGLRRLTRDDAVNRQADRRKLIAGSINIAAQSDQNAHIKGRRILFIRIGGETVGHLLGMPWRKTLDLIADNPRQELTRLDRNSDPPHHHQIGGQLKDNQAAARSARHLGRYPRTRSNDGEALFRLIWLPLSGTVVAVLPRSAHDEASVLARDRQRLPRAQRLAPSEIRGGKDLDPTAQDRADLNRRHRGPQTLL